MVDDNGLNRAYQHVAPFAYLWGKHVVKILITIGLSIFFHKVFSRSKDFAALSTELELETVQVSNSDGNILKHGLIQSDLGAMSCPGRGHIS